MRRTLFLFVLLLAVPVYSQDKNLPWQQFNEVGAAKLNFLFWSVYRARLLSETAEFEFSPSQAFALELEYQRDFSKSDLVSETRRQWEEIGMQFNREWLEQLSTLLVDVKEKDQITLFVDKRFHSYFYHNGNLTGAIKDSDFTKHFAGIWLSEDTTRPAMRKNLLGNS